MIQRAYFETIARRIDEPRKFIQIIEGPRRVGKSLPTTVHKKGPGALSPWSFFENHLHLSNTAH